MTSKEFEEAFVKFGMSELEARNLASDSGSTNVTIFEVIGYALSRALLESGLLKGEVR